jgi:hypothetical protein
MPLQKEDTSMTPRLADIVNRQRTARSRDAMFACVVVLAAILGAITVGTAANAASPHHLARHG